MDNSESKLTDQRLAAMMATQTAIMARLRELLISRGAIARPEIVNDLHELLTLALKESPQGVGPLNHLLALIYT